jgi:hypothetical protein
VWPCGAKGRTDSVSRRAAKKFFVSSRKSCPELRPSCKLLEDKNWLRKELFFLVLLSGRTSCVGDRMRVADELEVMAGKNH